MEWFETIKNWFLGLGENYNVNPYIFGGIYVGAIPFFFLSLYWTIKNIKNKKPAAFPAFLTGLFFISAYLYLIVVGKNIPAWVYVFIGILVLYGAYSTINTINKKSNKNG